MSGTAFLATVIVLATDRGAANALSLLAGFVLGGERVAAALEACRAWLTANVATAAFVVALVFGSRFTGQAIVELLA